MRVKDYRFIKPSEHALFDLFNKTYSTDFTPAELTLEEVEPIVQTQSSSQILPPNARAKIKFVAMEDDERGTRWYKYRRLTLSSFIPLAFRVMSEDIVDDEMFINEMLTRFRINVDDEGFAWTVTTDSGGDRTYTLTPYDTNPVWIGSVAIVCIDNTSLAAIDLVNEATGPEDEDDGGEEEEDGNLSSSVLGGEYTFTQSVPSTAWYIEHNLDCYPTVTTIDNIGDDVIGSILYLSKNILQVVFNSPMSGIAILR